MKFDRKTVLVITPALSGGSWICIKELIEGATDTFRFIVAGIGTTNQKDKKSIFYIIPYLTYDKWSLFLSSNSLLSLVYKLPLLLLSLLLIMVYRPKIVIGNGFVPSLAAIFPAKLIGSKVVVFHHGYLTYYVGTVTKKTTQILSNHVDHVFVNSEGSKKDVSLILNPSKITSVEHWADDAFFSIKNRFTCRKKLGVADKFVVLYVGRLDREKHCTTLIKVIEELRLYSDDIVFLFAGSGELVSLIKKFENKNKNVRYLGYITDRTTLHSLYASAHIVWSYADETYIAKPAVEALASGTPVIIPDKPAILRKALRNTKINHDLIPDEVGWIVDNENKRGISKLVLEIKNNKIVNDLMRDRCTNYAKKKHSKENIRTAIEKLIHLSKS